MAQSFEVGILQDVELLYKDRVECVVDENLRIKRLKFTDVVQEKAASEKAEDAAQLFDVEFALMTLELSSFIAAIIEAFGGENQDYLDNPNKLLQEKMVSALADDDLPAGVEEL